MYFNPYAFALPLKCQPLQVKIYRIFKLNLCVFILASKITSQKVISVYISLQDFTHIPLVVFSWFLCKVLNSLCWSVKYDINQMRNHTYGPKTVPCGIRLFPNVSQCTQKCIKFITFSGGFFTIVVSSTDNNYHKQSLSSDNTWYNNHRLALVSCLRVLHPLKGSLILSISDPQLRNLALVRGT